MAKAKIPSINEVSKYLAKERLLPLFFLIGEDDYSIDNAIEEIRKSVEPHVLSEFDKEFISLDKNSNLTQILDLAYSFPFGGGKKLLVIKNFENLSNKKDLSSYVNNSAEFSVLVFAQYSKAPTEPLKEPYNLLFEKKYLFEARNETGDDLIEWVMNRTEKLNLGFSNDFARGLIEITGNDKGLLEMQLQKISDYSINKPKLSFDEIKKITSPTKQYSIFDLQDSLGAGNKSKAVEIAFNLIDAGVELVMIVNMLAKFINTVAQITEMIRSKVNDNEASQMIGVSRYYYINCKKARYFMSDERLLRASSALLNADLSVKTTNTEPKTVLLVLVSEMLG
ncbi:MAG: DNA polymerase III subunit delta [Melioribacteraceae bacterium]|jgi:DNA polymerase-3 subunit delta|nr:DNA polymerase III subunit delta [Melioribacteraceae bacterium]